MKSVSLRSLKENLSKYTEEAAQGTALQVTRYNKPYVYITGAHTPSLHIGKRAGSGSLRSIGKNATGGTYLSALKEDRKD